MATAVQIAERDDRVFEAWQAGALDGYDLGREALSRATGYTADQCRRAKDALRKAGRLSLANPEFEIEELPDELPPVEEIIARRRREWAQKDGYEQSRHLVNVKVKLAGPIGLLHMGDPHVDDPGTDFPSIERDVELVQRTEGLFAGNIGDQQNNWIGRLARLYGKQTVSEAESWALTEWLVKSVPWLYLILGNHDVWSGAGDPIKWMLKPRGGKRQALMAAHGARLNLVFPNRKQVRINARHDFPGSSVWNPNHGPMKEAQIGFRDHVLVCGHKHISGHTPIKDPQTGLISHCIRVAGYKVHDEYAKQLNLKNQRISASFVTIIDPRFEDSDPRLITTLYDTESAADYLTWLRTR